MKIVVVTNLFPPHGVGGFEIRCEQVSRALAARGHEIIVVTSTSGLPGPRLDSDGLRIHRILDLYAPFVDAATGSTLPIERNRIARWRTTRRNYRIARDLLQVEKPDLVFGWGQARLSLGAMRAAQDLGIPLAWTFGDANIAQYAPAPFRTRSGRLLDYALDRLLASTTWTGLDFSYTHSVSAFTRGRLVERGLPIQGGRVIYRGIPLEKFPPRDDVGEIHSPARILYLGQVQSSKGVHTVIKALQLVNDKSETVRAQLTVAGDGSDEYKRQLQALADTHHTPVAFIGKVPHADVPRLFREHDIFVFSSTPQSREGFGGTALEAMASGLPVIGTLTGGMAELFHHEVNALVFQAENAPDLASQLERLLGDAELRRRLAHRARVLIEQEFNLAVYAERMEQFLFDAFHRGSLAAARPAPAVAGHAPAETTRTNARR